MDTFDVWKSSNSFSDIFKEKMILNSILVVLCFGLNNSDYTFDPAGNYEVSENSTDSGYVNIYSVNSTEGTPKYLIYIVKSELSFEAENDIKSIDSELIESVLIEIRSVSKSQGTFKSFGFMTGLSMEVEIESSGKHLPGYLVITSKGKSLFKIVFIAPTKEHYDSNINEFIGSLNTFRFLD